MKHLCGDRSESVPRPQRAQHAHERARRRPLAAAGPSIPLWRAQRPQIFEEELLKGVPATLRRSSVSMAQPRERTCSERTTASEAQVKAASSAGKRQGETVCRCGWWCGCMVERVGRQAG